MDRVETEKVEEPLEPLNKQGGTGEKVEKLSVPPTVSMHKEYRTRKMDKTNLVEEEEKVVSVANMFNREWSRDHNNTAEDSEVVVFGSVDLSAEEMNLLNLGPNFLVTSFLSKEQMQVEAQVTMTKMRWGRRGKGQENMSDHQVLLDDMDQDKESVRLSEMLQKEQRDVLSNSGGELDMGRLRATDQHNNRRVLMPGPATAAMEAMYNTRSGVWQETFARHVDAHCNKKGVQKTSNLTQDQNLALKKLKKKIDKLELIVVEADKGQKFVVMDEHTYVSMAKDHTDKDVIVDSARVHQAQRVLSATGKSLATVFGVGRTHSTRNNTRCHENVGSEAEDVPYLKLLPKLHKPVSPQGHPQSRPVVAAATGLTSRPGDVISDVLTPLFDMMTTRMEDKSTEEVLSQLTEAQEQIWRDGDMDIVAGSLDVRALYSSLDIDGSAEIVEQFIMESPVEIKGTDLRAAQVFLCSNMSEGQVKSEGLLKLLPKRRHSRGFRPGPTTTELSVCKEHIDSAVVSKWGVSPSPESLTPTQQRLLIAKVVKVAIQTVFSNDCYQFKGDMFLQLAGGLIGLRLTSLVARIVMDKWMTSFLSRLDNAGVKINAATKYVDDINVLLRAIRPGTRWRGDVLVHSKEHAEDVMLGLTLETSTMIRIKEAADAILPWLQFTWDSPEQHESLKVPMLDLQVWVSAGADLDPPMPDIVCWEFFEKAASLSKVLRATSVFEWRQKIVTMNMEMFRRHRNTSRQVSVQRRIEIMCQFIVKLRLSGYSAKTVQNVVMEGMRYYYRKLQTKLNGGPALNARLTQDLVQGRRSKLGASEAWYRRRRGGEKEKERKVQGWRSAQGPNHSGWTGGIGSNKTQRDLGQGCNMERPDLDEMMRDPEATLVMPYTVGSKLRTNMQQEEDSYSAVVRCRRVRMVEAGGTS